MQHQQPAAIRRLMHHLVEQQHAAELYLRVVAQPLVMVAGDVDDLGALARLAQHLLDDVVVALRPVPGATQPPTIDDVADEIEIVGLGVAQEIEQEFRLASARTQMDV